MPVGKGFHWSVMARQERTRRSRDEMPFRGAMFSKVLAPDVSLERVSIESFLGQKVINFAYPFTSTNAWMRG